MSTNEKREAPGKGRSSEKVPCACCAIFFESKICPQCQVAGCGLTVGRKGHKCNLQANLLRAMQLSEFQVRAELAELQTKYAELQAEAQRLAQIALAEKAPALSSKDIELVHRHGVLDAAGVDPSALRGKASMLDATAGNDPRFGHPPTPDNRQHTTVNCR